MGPTDDSLAQRAKSDAAAFRELYEKWVTPVYRYFLYRVNNVKEAEDLTSQVFLKVCEQLPSYKENGRFPAWLFTIVRHQSADYFRSQPPALPLAEETHQADAPTPLEHATLSDDLGRLKRLLQTLPEEEQELIRLRFVVQLSYKDIAAILKRGKEAVRKQVARLLDRLQSQLEEDHV
jgi:RNA polymerase sigma-70 factor (ECF subfamily)